MTEQRTHQDAVHAWQAGDTDAAIGLWQQRLETNPDDVDALVQLGGALRSLLGGDSGYDLVQRFNVANRD